MLSISNLSDLNEKKKYQIRIEKWKLKSQELRYQRQRVSQLYAKNQGKVFRKFREAIKKDKGNEKPAVPQFNNDQLRPETNITKEEYERFWTPIWENAQEFDHRSTWVNEFDKAVSSRIIHQSTEEIKVPKKMVTDKMKRCRNWNAPGRDKICNYWLKGLESTNELLESVLEQFINRQTAIPNQFTGGRTVMLDKDGEESAAYKRPISCLNTIYKLCTKIIRTFLINHNMKYDLIQLDQRGSKARSLGSIDCINNHKNLSCAWYDVRKAYDAVSHQWLLKCLEIHRVPKNLCDFIRRIDKGSEFLGPIDILRGILQGDSFYVTLFIMGGYKMSTMKEKITHLMFVDDLKTFQKSEQKLAVVSNKIKSMMHDLGLELNLEKCASVHLKRGKYTASENLPIDKDSTIKALQQADTYKFLGKEESIKQLNDIVISDSTKEFFQRLWIIWQSDLTLPRKFEAIKIFASPKLLYYMWTTEWPVDELRRVDRKVRSIISECS